MIKISETNTKGVYNLAFGDKDMMLLAIVNLCFVFILVKG